MKIKTLEKDETDYDNPLEPSDLTHHSPGKETGEYGDKSGQARNPRRAQNGLTAKKPQRAKISEYEIQSNVNSEMIRTSLRPQGMYKSNR